MIDISLGGLIGAMAGTAIAAVVYGPLLSLVDRAFAARQTPQDERALPRQELALLRRCLLIFDLAIFAGLGYWLGETIGG